MIPQDRNLNPLAGYLLTLCNPKKQMSRIPDAFGEQTALFRSLQVFDLSITTNTTPDNGRFSFACQPTLGSISNLHFFKVACVDGSIPWPNGNFDDGTKYLSVVGGTDLRLDPYYFNMTQPSGFFFQVYCDSNVGDPNPVAGMTAAEPYGDLTANGYARGLAQSDQLNYQLNPVYTLAGGVSNFIVPAGEYYFFAYNLGGGAFTLLVSNGNFIEQSDTFSSFPVNTEVGILVARNDCVISLSCATAPTVAYLALAPAFAEGIVTTANNGAATMIRPVGMSCLATYINTSLLDAGNIAAAWVAGDTCLQSFFTARAGNNPGQLQNWDNLAKYPGAYDGPLRDGAYVWWAPKTERDTDFYPPDEMNTRPYPCLIVSGQYAPTGVAADTSIQVLRVEICTVYEFQTSTLLWELNSLNGNQLIMDMALRVINQSGHAGKNDEHVNFFTRVKQMASAGAKMLGNLLWDNRGTIAKTAAGAVMTLL